MLIVYACTVVNISNKFSNFFYQIESARFCAPMALYLWASMGLIWGFGDKVFKALTTPRPITS